MKNQKNKMEVIGEDVVIEGELNPESLMEWLSVVDDGKKIATKRSDLSFRVRKHLSALGWTFSYHPKKKRELRYKSPSGRWYYSLATACKACVQQQQQHQLQDVPTIDLSWSPRNRDESNQKQTKDEEIYRIEDFDITGLTLNEENPASDSIKIIPNFDISNHQHKRKGLKSCDTKSSSSDEENPFAILPCVGVSNTSSILPCVGASYQLLKNKDCEGVKDCDTAGTSTPNTETPSSDSIQIVPSIDILNHQHKRKRLKSCDTKGSNSSDEENLSAILPCVGVSNQEPKKKDSEGVKDCDTAAFNRETPDEETDSIEIVDTSPPNDEDKAERRPRIGKPLMKILSTMKKKDYMEKESLRFWRKDNGPGMNREECSVCRSGEDLIQCKGCPSSFHLTCLGLLSLPEEELWFCPCCCCDICGSMDSPGNSMLMTCEQCQRRFHLKCLEEESYAVSGTAWFCSNQCNRVFGKLQSLIGCEIAVGDEDLVWKLMRAPNEDEPYDDEQNSKLDSAVEILYRVFDDPLSEIDLFEELIFKRDGSGTARGCYMVLIEKNNEPIVVAALRVDKDVAEIPLMATSPNYRSVEMCRVLMDELEKQMTQMGVLRLIGLVAEECLDAWTEQFGFSVMESSEKLEFLKQGMFDFVGTVMCHKFLR